MKGANYTYLSFHDCFSPTRARPICRSGVEWIKLHFKCDRCSARIWAVVAFTARTDSYFEIELKIILQTSLLQYLKQSAGLPDLQVKGKWTKIQTGIELLMEDSPVLLVSNCCQRWRLPYVLVAWTLLAGWHSVNIYLTTWLDSRMLDILSVDFWKQCSWSSGSSEIKVCRLQSKVV